MCDISTDDLLVVEARELVQAAGSVWIFAGVTTDGHDITFGVDHREAARLLDILTEDGPFPVGLESWQVLS